MITFEKTIGESECNSGYLNLTSDTKETYGKNFPPPLTPLIIITSGKQYLASMNKQPSQIYGGLARWFRDESIYPGDKIRISYDATRPQIDQRVPVDIVVLQRAEITELSSATIPEEEVERVAEINMQMERDLENYLVNNLHLIDKDLKLYTSDEGKSGRQYNTEVGPIDLLCKMKDDFVVIELKKGRSGDQVVGQISRYIGWVKEKLANGKNVRGTIIVHDFDPKLKYAVLANPIIDLKYYQIKIDFVTEDDIINRNGN